MNTYSVDVKTGPKLVLASSPNLRRQNTPFKIVHIPTTTMEKLRMQNVIAVFVKKLHLAWK